MLAVQTITSSFKYILNYDNKVLTNIIGYLFNLSVLILNDKFFTHYKQTLANDNRKQYGK